MAIHLDRVDSRARLVPRRDPYFQRLTQGRYIGFRLMAKGAMGTWLARAYDGEKYVHKPLGDFASLQERERYDAARKAAEGWFRHLDLGGAVDSATVRGACEAYVAQIKAEKSERAATDAEGRFRRLVYDDPLARVDIGKLTSLQVAGWKKRVLDRGGTKGSFNRNATALRAAFNLALKRRAVASDHSWVNELVAFKGADGRRDLYLPKAGRKKLIDKSSKEAQPFVRGLALLPLRPGDVASLRVADLDATHGVLAVPAGKTGARKIPMSGDPLLQLKAAAKGKAPDAWLFSRDDGRQWKKEAWRDEIKAAAKEAKLPAGTCAYTLRHSAITDLVTSGMDLFHVAQLAGTSIAMIEKHYAQLRRQQVRDGLQVLSLK